MWPKKFLWLKKFKNVMRVRVESMVALRGVFNEPEFDVVVTLMNHAPTMPSLTPAIQENS